MIPWLGKTLFSSYIDSLLSRPLFFPPPRTPYCEQIVVTKNSTAFFGLEASWMDHSRELQTGKKANPFLWHPFCFLCYSWFLVFSWRVWALRTLVHLWSLVRTKTPGLFMNGFFFIRHCCGNLFTSGRAHVTITYMGAKSANERSAIFFFIYFSFFMHTSLSQIFPNVMRILLLRWGK